MRLNAILAASLATAALVGVSGHKAFAAAPTAGSKPAPHYVTVQQGDYLAAIAAANNTTYERIFDANQQVQDPNIIFPGQQLRVPNPTEQLPDRPMPGSQAVNTSAVAPTDAPVTTPVVSPPSPAVTMTNTGSGVWDSLAQCESGGNWSADTGNGFYGGLQFTLSSWQAAGGSGSPSQASPSEQIMRAEILQSRQGWGAWPACSAKLGL